MSNFQIFNKQYLSKLIDPFLPGATDHITPIMYQAFSPDIFMFLFRTTGWDNQDHFFVSFQYDYIKDPDIIRDIVRKWIGAKPIQVLATAETDRADNENNRKLVCEDDPVYKSVMLLVPRPNNLGYWSEYIVVRLGDNIDKVLKDFTVKERQQVKKLLEAGTDEREINVCRINGDMELFYSP